MTPELAAALHAPLLEGAVRPLVAADAAALKAACAADADGWTIYATDFGPAGFDRAFGGLLADEGRLPFAVLAAGAVVGMTAYLRLDAGAQTVEIGNSYLAPAHRRTGLNRAVKRALLDHAFGCGIRRVEFRIDERNAASQAAVAALGAVKEGVLRAERVTWTGHVRDTGLWAILRDAWCRTAG